MPGPRLEGRFSNPQPIVAENGINTAQILAGAVSSGLKIADTYIQKEEERSDKEAQVALFKEFNKIDETARQDETLSSQWADTQKNNALLLAAKRNPNILQAGIALYNQGTPAGTQLKAQETLRASTQKEREDRYQAKLVKYSVDEADPNAKEKVANAIALEHQAMIVKDQNEASLAKGSLTKQEYKHEAHTNIRFDTAVKINDWTSAIGVTPEAYNERTDEQKATLVAQIDTYIANYKRSQIAMYGEHLPLTDLNDMLVPLEERASVFKKLLTGEYTYDVATKTNNLISALATQIEAPTPEAKVLMNLAKEAANSRNYEAFMKMFVSGPAAKAMRAAIGSQYETIMSSVLGDDRNRGASVVEAIQTKHARTSLSKTIYDSLTTSDLDIDDTSAKSLANSVTAISMAHARSPNSFDVPAWSGMVDFTISRTGKKALASEDFQEAKQYINKGLGWYSVQVSKAATNHIPSDGEVFITEEGKVDIKLGGEYDEYNRASSWAAWNREIENWRQTHGARINKLAQARAVITGADPKEILTEFMYKSGLVLPTSDTSELSHEDTLALEIMVEQGEYPDIISARRELGL